jgi:murein L,D-transpeptidase YcbB/YkuD
MKKLRDLVRSVILGSGAALTAAGGNAARGDVPDIPPLTPPDDRNLSLKQQVSSDQPPTLVLKKVALSDDWTLASHRSHRSHSSHRSHYSSYSSPDTSSRPKASPESTPKKENPAREPSGASSTQSVGARTLRKGMAGPDVIELKKLLVSKGYKLQLTEDFDELTEVVVKDFQAKNGIPDDGIVAPLTLYMLKGEK